MSRWDRWPTRVASGNAAGRLPRGKPDEGKPHVRFGKREQETGRNHRACSLLHYRAIDQFGQAIDVLVAEKRDSTATRRFFIHALEHGLRSTEVSTDRAPATRGCSMSCCPPPATLCSSMRTIVCHER